jgi:LuxR family maltose regulon positive regulatory protein
VTRALITRHWVTTGRSTLLIVIDDDRGGSMAVSASRLALNRQQSSVSFRAPRGFLEASTTSAKFFPPALPRHWIRRDRLDRLLTEALQHRLTVVTGAPGAGKTVLLADWAHGRPNGLVAWLSVEAADNDRGCFWRQVASALADVNSHDDASGDTAPEDVRPFNLLVRHTSANRPRVLIIDDFHLITDPSLVDAVAHLVHHLPAHLRVVLAGQGPTGFPLHELLAAGEATVLGDHHLRFTVEESAALIALASNRLLPPDEVAMLAERSEGWAAGIYLAGVGLADADDTSGFVRRYSGSYGPVAEYLEHEILLRQPPDILRFLLETSVLGSFSAGLARAVTGLRDAGEILEGLSEQSQFVIRLDSGDAMFRYHRLLADVLASRLQREDPSLGRQAHVRAATWFERRGAVRTAAQHFAQGHAYDRALTLVFSSIGQDLGNGRTDDNGFLGPAEGSSGIPVDADAGRLYVQAATLLGAFKVSDAAQLLRRLNTVTAPHADGPRWKGRVEFLWAVHADGIADAAGALEHCRAAGELMGPTPPRPHGSVPGHEPGLPWLEKLDAAVATHLPLLAARAHIRLGQPDRARPLLVDRFGTEERAEAAHPATLAMMSCGQGRLKNARRLATVALQQCEEHGEEVDFVRSDAHLVLAEVLLEHNDLDSAEQELEAARRLPGVKLARPTALWVEIGLIRVLMAKQRLGEALNRITQLHQLDRRRPQARFLLQKLDEVEIGCRIGLGDLEGALQIARSSPGEDISPETLARIDLCAGRPDRAISRLRTARSVGLATEVRRLVLIAWAEMQQGQVERANDTFRLAVEAGRPEHYVRPFLEEPVQTIPLLQAAAAVRTDLYLAQLAAHAERSATPTNQNGSATMIQPLTGREREVLGYLPSHLNREQIATQMYVSPNTVKTHMKSLYRKIGANSRAEAVTIARFHGLFGLTTKSDWGS